jgi:Na+-transporting NADH:ubiquinone oxidoreductase subunit D
MSEVAVEVAKEEKKEPLFSKKTRKILTNPLDIDNPITLLCL